LPALANADTAREAGMPAWAAKLRVPSRYKAIYGGRGGGKSRSVALELLLRGLQQRLRILCVREVQKSIDESVKEVLDGWIDRLELGSFYRSQKTAIDGNNGTHFFFKGMSDTYRTAEQIKSLEEVDIVWFEEAQTMSSRSWELLRPTMRGEESELWLTFNPRYRSDPVYRDFVRRPLDDAIIIPVHYKDNPYFPDVLERERLQTLKSEPARYSHIWLGEPDDEGDVKLVLPFALAEQCVDAHIKAGISRSDLEGRYDAGLDVADTGADKNALVMRIGPLIASAESWSSSRIGQTARRANTRCIESGVNRLYYDVGGPGGGVRSYLLEIEDRPYFADPVNFGGKVTGEEREYSHRVKNKDFFMRRNSQMAWNLRLRAQRTQRLLDGEAINPMSCLFISSNIPDLDEYLNQLAQPVWDENQTGKLVIDKMPEEGMRSPDLYDATALAFGWDSRNGLKA